MYMDLYIKHAISLTNFGNVKDNILPSTTFERYIGTRAHTQHVLIEKLLKRELYRA